MAVRIEFRALTTGFDKVRSRIKSLFSSTTGTNILLGLRQIQGMMSGIINFTGRAVTGIMNLAKHFDHIAKSARRTGVSFENFQKLTFVAQIAGATFENVERTFRTFQQRLLDLRLGNVTKLNSLAKDLKLNMAEIDKMSPFDAFLEVFSAIDKIGDANLKRAIAQAFGGRGGTQTLPMIENFREIATIFRDFDVQIQSSALAGAEKLDDMMLLLNSQVKKLVSEFKILEWSAQQVAKANIAMMIARGKYGSDTNMPSGETIGRFAKYGSIALAPSTGGASYAGYKGMEALIKYFSDVNENLKGATKGFLPDLETSLSDLRKQFGVSSMTSGTSFSSTRSAFSSMGGFATESIKSMSVNNPQLEQLQKANYWLSEISTALKDTDQAELRHIDRMITARTLANQVSYTKGGR